MIYMNAINRIGILSTVTGSRDCILSGEQNTTIRNAFVAPC